MAFRCGGEAPHQKAIGACRPNRVKKNRKNFVFFPGLCCFDAEAVTAVGSPLADEAACPRFSACPLLDV